MAAPADPQLSSQRSAFQVSATDMDTRIVRAQNLLFQGRNSREKYPTSGNTVQVSAALAGLPQGACYLGWVLVSLLLSVSPFLFLYYFVSKLFLPFLLLHNYTLLSVGHHRAGSRRYFCWFRSCLSTVCGCCLYPRGAMSPWLVSFSCCLSLPSSRRAIGKSPEPPS